MKVALLISDGGDGSASIHYFKDIQYASELLGKEDFNLNEGMDIIDVPHTFTPPGGFSDYTWELNEGDD